MKVEQGSSAVDVSDSKEDQPDDACSVAPLPQRSVVDDPIDAFSIERHKKSIAGGAVEDAKSKGSDEIRQRNREKKHQRESTVQETPSVSRERKNGQGLIQEMSSSAKENLVPTFFLGIFL